jgi:hypothetical protein
MADPPPRSTNLKPRNPNWGGRRERSGPKKKNTSTPKLAASAETSRSIMPSESSGLKITLYVTLQGIKSLIFITKFSANRPPRAPNIIVSKRNSRPGVLLNHNPEERIGGPDELEPTTLPVIGKRKRKRRRYTKSFSSYHTLLVV